MSNGEGQRTSPLPIDTPAAAVQTFELPGNAVFPESVGVDPATGDGYVGSLADGALYRLSSAARVELWSAAGQDGHGSVAGVKVDTGGRLWAAGGYDGTLWVYDLSSCALLARLDVGARPSCVNDIAFGPDGEAYVTDSLVPVLFRAGGEPLALERWVDLAGQGVPWPDGLNLNGIVLTADARHLVAYQTNLGRSGGWNWTAGGCGRSRWTAGRFRTATAWRYRGRSCMSPSTHATCSPSSTWPRTAHPVGCGRCAAARRSPSPPPLPCMPASW
jgi:sugar lactone lactonase YvrE